MPSRWSTAAHNSSPRGRGPCTCRCARRTHFGTHPLGTASTTRSSPRPPRRSPAHKAPPRGTRCPRTPRTRRSSCRRRSTTRTSRRRRKRRQAHMRRSARSYCQGSTRPQGTVSKFPSPPTRQSCPRDTGYIRLSSPTHSSSKSRVHKARRLRPRKPRTQPSTSAPSCMRTLSRPAWRTSPRHRSPRARSAPPRTTARRCRVCTCSRSRPPRKCPAGTASAPASPRDSTRRRRKRRRTTHSCAASTRAQNSPLHSYRCKRSWSRPGRRTGPARRGRRR